MAEPYKVHHLMLFAIIQFGNVEDYNFEYWRTWMFLKLSNIVFPFLIQTLIENFMHPEYVCLTFRL